MKAERLEEIHFELEEFDPSNMPWSDYWRPLKGKYSSKEDAEWMMSYLRLIKGKNHIRVREIRRRSP